MNGQDFIRVLAKEAEMTQKDTKKLLDSISVAYAKVVAEGGEVDVSITGLGKLITKVKPASTGRNPKTGEPIEIAEKYQVKFRLTPSFKKTIKDTPIVVVAEGTEVAE